MQGNPLQARRALAAAGPFDLVVAGACGHPYRHILDSLGDWDLVERDRAALDAIVQTAGGMRIEAAEPDPTGLAWLVDARR